MTFYIILWVLLLLIGNQYNITRKIPSRYFFILIILVLSFIVAARENTVGADTANYVNFYYAGIAPDKISGAYEPAFMLVRNICYYLGFNHFVFLYVLSFSSLYIVFVVADRLKIKNYYLSLFIYFSIVFLSYQFNTIRSGMMASVVWLGFSYKVEGKNRAALIAILIAAGFHVAALAFIPVLFLVNKFLSKKIIFAIIFFALICVFFRLGQRLIEMFPILASIDRLSGYIDTSVRESYGITLGTVVNICLFMFMYNYYHKEYQESIEYRVILNTMLFAIMVVCVFNAFNAIVTRIGQVLNLSLLFVWPYLIDKVKSSAIKLGISAMLCVYLWLYYDKALKAVEFFSQNLAYIPYEWSFTGLFR